MNCFDILISDYFAPFAPQPWATFLYVYGYWPAWITVTGFFCAALYKKIPWTTALYVMSVFAIGAGLLVNVLLKDHWGRPRPVQTTRYGGTVEFRPFYSPDFSANGQKSFPSGHVATGAFFFAPARVSKSRFFFYTALVLSLLLSLARIAQGGHFFSDCAFSVIIMYLTSSLLAKAFRIVKA